MQQQEKDALKKSEEAAEQGNVDESMAFANQAEQLQKQYTELHKLATTPDRTMQVCEVCGVFINSSDSDQRKAVGILRPLSTELLAIAQSLSVLAVVSTSVGASSPDATTGPRILQVPIQNLRLVVLRG